MLINMFSLSPFTPLVDILSTTSYVIFVSFMGEKKNVSAVFIQCQKSIILNYEVRFKPYSNINCNIS